jgi:hypothetical protein
MNDLDYYLTAALAVAKATNQMQRVYQAGEVIDFTAQNIPAGAELLAQVWPNGRVDVFGMEKEAIG